MDLFQTSNVSPSTMGLEHDLPQEFLWDATCVGDALVSRLPVIFPSSRRLLLSAAISRKSEADYNEMFQILLVNVFLRECNKMWHRIYV